ncbi:MAG: hypothetical protein ABIH38_01545 [Patescibacteria group bacterium]
MKKTIAIICLLASLSPNLVLAYAFDKNNIISDSDLTNSSAMSLSRIQEFLTVKGGTLGQYSCNVSGTIKSAAEIISEIATAYRLNPKFLLTTLQKEQSLITDSSPSQDQYDWALGYGVCDSCSKSDPALQIYKGLYNQLYYAGSRLRGDYYLGGLEKYGHTISGYGPGITKIVDGETVTPANNATAVLYTYTPHISGNLSFWNIWSRWFLIKYPNGSLLRVAGENGIWLIRNNKRYNFVSRSAFIFSYDPKKVIDVSLNDLQAYEYGAPIKFADYSLLQAPSGGVYLLVNGEKRPIISREAFRNLGYSPEEKIMVTWDDLAAYPTGEKITADTTNPTGVLLQAKETGGIYYIANNQKHAIFSREILNSQFSRRKWTTVPQSEIDKYESGDPVYFRDGELITSPSANGVYLIADGQKHPIPSAEIFNQMGFKWSNIIRTTDRSLEIHPLGDKIDYLTQ